MRLACRWPGFLTVFRTIDMEDFIIKCMVKLDLEIDPKSLVHASQGLE
jgi:hypothetical protein